MKTKINYIIALFVLLAACQQNSSSTTDSSTPTKDTTVTFPERAAAMAVYEVNIRQATPEGTIQAFAQHLPRLKKLGVEMLWIMPVQPISLKNRKGTLGSYYAIADYSAINPEFGSLADFKSLVQQAHDMGMVVILDWVPNHTGWDHPWITAHPEYYAKDSLGNITYEADWTDIALLDHRNPGTRKSMIEEMAFWIKEADIDGFRCDHAAHEIPLYFWEEATDQLNSMKDLFWLAEWDEPRLHRMFHASYSWELLHLTEDVAKGHKTADDIADFIKKDQAKYGRKAFRMTITTNHDENSWAGTVFERYGEGHKAFATFIFSAYGFPMIYNGQEVGLDKRLEFFEKDSIDWTDPKGLSRFYKQLLSLKKDNPALWNGGFGAPPERINADENIYAFKRIKDGNQVIGIINMSDQPQSLQLTDKGVYGDYADYFTGTNYTLSSETLTLDPWQYLIFTN